MQTFNALAKIVRISPSLYGPTRVVARVIRSGRAAEGSGIWHDLYCKEDVPALGETVGFRCRMNNNNKFEVVSMFRQVVRL